MTKFKAVVLLVSGAALAIFTAQNWQYPNPPVHFLGFQFLPFPLSVIILGFLGGGFLAGWLACVLRARKHHPEAVSEAPPEPPQEN
jgi:uncharacterized integral membrane protein